MSLAAAVIAHHLRLLGIRTPPPVAVGDDEPRGPGSILVRPGAAAAAAAGVRVEETVDAAPAVLRGRRRLRTLHAYDVLGGGEPLVTDAQGRAVWVRSRGVLVLGTDLAADLVRYRQGDPARVEHGQAGALWGIPGERPLYLFEPQLEGEDKYERHADWWADELAAATGSPRTPLLPGGAPGAVVVTGDDDQAFLETYAEQLRLLEGIPMTYFLHPLTRHTPATLAELPAGVELELHPDALEAPERYGELLAEQARWFAGLTGRRATAVRNHGYLNAGYWGHARAWLDEGIRLSANVPGVDGRVLNGSLLPARLALDGALTAHWSLLTAIGDGVFFALGYDDDAAAACVADLAAEIVREELPGIVVLNLHPQNVERTAALHDAARLLVQEGFQAWTLRQCLAWFEQRDGVV